MSFTEAFDEFIEVFNKSIYGFNGHDTGMIQARAKRYKAVWDKCKENPAKHHQLVSKEFKKIFDEMKEQETPSVEKLLKHLERNDYKIEIPSSKKASSILISSAIKYITIDEPVRDEFVSKFLALAVAAGVEDIEPLIMVHESNTLSKQLKKIVIENSRDVEHSHPNEKTLSTIESFIAILQNIKPKVTKNQFVKNLIRNISRDPPAKFIDDLIKSLRNNKKKISIEVSKIKTSDKESLKEGICGMIDVLYEDFKPHK